MDGDAHDTTTELSDETEEEEEEEGETNVAVLPKVHEGPRVAQSTVLVVGPLLIAFRQPEEPESAGMAAVVSSTSAKPHTSDWPIVRLRVSLELQGYSKIKCHPN